LEPFLCACICFRFQTNEASILDEAIEDIKYMALQRRNAEQLGMVHQSSSEGIRIICCPSLPRLTQCSIDLPVMENFLFIQSCNNWMPLMYVSLMS